MTQHNEIDLQSSIRTFLEKTRGLFLKGDPSVMFVPTIGKDTPTSEINDQVAQALSEGLTVRLGRWTGRPTGGGRVEFTLFSDESRSGPLVDQIGSMGFACPEDEAAHVLICHWLGDW